ncbi:MAG TPA: HlyD family secretion protein, partial [Stellaceae bacterium]|nr:HlyD family secretion protein [Stellaceae bacterium]
MTASNEAAHIASGRRRARSRRGLLEGRSVRLLLMASVPVAVVLVAGYLYLFGGRYVSTDDAYVKADKVTLSADVAGRVTAIDVHDNEPVKRGQVLFQLDDRPYRYALEKANANLAATRLQIEALRASYRQKQADLQAAQDTLAYEQKELERNKALAAAHAVSAAALDSAQHQQQMARQSMAATQQQIANILASLGGNPDIPTDQHPLVLQAQAAVDQAQLDLSHASVYAPMDGTVSKVDTLQVGEYLTVGAPAFSLISNRVWIEANFKETDLAHMHPGDTATVTVDTYPDHSFEARVESLSPGTGAEFSVLPPQNATGNWVKVTQRLPVRLAIENADGSLPLHTGMSADVEVDTKYRNHTLALIEH